ncbi:DUF1996 domain-containing protein [Rheinheimera sp. 4Y26]|uniref:DUF1996 domain-containing protein n=1 Tax=Rheinheimera sp. 4Y26 TaxID=2977811 RepID=UPI0021B14474|nr:DUF1996 domain-containing protein [Rheinheimera sp. 4Y26]MCT6701221.1 DUF1996 domain-containing protein [Rheinheimera sp. 4Y26]
MKLLKICCVFTVSGVLTACGGSESADSTAVPQQPVASTPQAPTLSKQPESVTQTPYATVEFSAPAAQSYRCQLNDEPVVACTSPHQLYPLSVKQHQLQVWTVGADGNESAPAAIRWTVESAFPASAAGRAHPDLIATSVQPAPSRDNSWRGIFRINCDLSHSGYVDPIVFPGKANAAHLHNFYGNFLLDEQSTEASLFTAGESSCQGNSLNRSAYWVPALLAPSYDAITGQRLLDAQGAPAWKVVPAVVGNDDEAHEVFYYSAGVDDLSAIQPIPLGLKMIAGSHMGKPGQEQDTSIVRWHCQSWESSDGQNPRWSTSIPQCVAPDRLRMDIFFPSCWNGLDLDSADHKSHLAYPVKSSGTGGMVCPGTHPVPIIRVSFHYAFGVKPDVYDPNTKSSAGWRFASDMYDVTATTPGGMSLHGDWFNAWHPEVLQKILDVCIRQQLDCHDGNLGNGYRLTGTRKGVQNSVEIVNKGLGY